MYFSIDENCIKLVEQGAHEQLLQLLAQTSRSEVNNRGYGVTAARVITDHRIQKVNQIKASFKLSSDVHKQKNR